jgi:hypothetical protein
MTRRIAHLIEEHKNRLNLFRTIDLDVEVERTQKGSQTSTPARKVVLLVHPMKEYQKREVPMPKEDKNQN